MEGGCAPARPKNSMKYTALIDGERVDIEVIHSETAVIEAQVGGRKYSLDAKAVEPGIYWFNWNNRSIEISVTPNGDAYTVSAGGRRILVQARDRGAGSVGGRRIA